MRMTCWYYYLLLMNFFHPTNIHTVIDNKVNCIRLVIQLLSILDTFCKLNVELLINNCIAFDVGMP